MPPQGWRKQQQRALRGRRQRTEPDKLSQAQHHARQVTHLAKGNDATVHQVVETPWRGDDEVAAEGQLRHLWEVRGGAW